VGRMDDGRGDSAGPPRWPMTCPGPKCSGRLPASEASLSGSTGMAVTSRSPRNRITAARPHISTLTASGAADFPYGFGCPAGGVQTAAGGLIAVAVGSPRAVSVALTVALLADRYRLDQPIASGESGEVWRGTDTRLARPVAVKLLRPELAADAERLAQFRASARRTASLVHEGIARIYDYMEPGPSHPPFLVMEFVDGPSLADVMADGPMEPRRVMDLLAQVAQALHAAYQAGLLHGGIKPANVLLSRDGIVKLTEFGITASPRPASTTDAGTRAGALDCLEPERVDVANGTPAGDLYSLGILARQCLTGGLPPGSATVEVALVRRDPPEPALAADAAEVAALIGQLTANEPASRLHDAGEVARRASQLRDQLTADGVGDPGGAPGGMSPVPPVAQDSQQADETPTMPWRRGSPKRPGRRMLVAAAAVGAATIAVVLIRLFPAPGSHLAALGPAKPMTVDVNGPALRGQPVKVVRRQLRHLGLRARVRWVSSSQLSPGEVMSVRPAGRVATGTTIVVVAAVAPAGTAGGQSMPIGGGQPGATSKARHENPHRRGHPHAPGSPTPAGTPTPTVSPSPTSSHTPKPSATTAVSTP
jgi:eukaryotic-like serine/threonine-protein kinase